LTSAELIGRRDQALAGSPDLTWLAGLLIIAAITFNALLCFVNTHVAPISNAYVVGSEAIIITVTILACYRFIDPKYALIITTIIVYTAVLAFLRALTSPDEGMNLKVARDFLIPVIFFLLGKGANNIKVADRIVYVATTIILIFAVFEYVSLDAFLKVFSIVDYYVARGTLDALDPSLQWTNGLMKSGMRPPDQGRELLTFLGGHRVSSLFLEPIGLGNFGCLIAFWAIARSRMEHKFRLWSVAAGIVLIILSDTRFNASFFALGVLILLVSPRLTTPAILAMPFVIIFGLCLFAAGADPHGLPYLEGYSLKDRLLFSGRVLLDFDIANWLGITASRIPTADAGYAYIISNVGLLGFAAFWFWFMSLDGSSRYFYAFRNTSAAYFAAVSCVSTSQFTIKTAALLWFLMGALSVVQGRDVVVHRRARQSACPASIT
jgi:putative polymerase